MESEEKRKREFIFKSLRDQLNLEIKDSLHEQREEKEIDEQNLRNTTHLH